MELTKVERQILYNQCQILSVLCPEDKESLELKMIALNNGYTSEYEKIVNVYNDELSENECKFVYDVLIMYRSLYFSYEKLDDKLDISRNDVLFSGFDGNYECGYYSFACFLLKDKGLFEEFANVDTNSHASRVEIYERMLEVYNAISNDPSTDYENSLTKENIISVINARKRS